ncbi:uncharacterized protein Dmoj_GI16266 [Drosophila mojavensis]|uniref:PARP16 N-terminal domain-containing protein n=1 Tax=Drosophila mojavensis TaxID=7230 RepID=B4L613_DROMO|nr:uncharacterized protein Dmoj_GI16266 [Drosophila mojavensis]
MQNEQRNCRCSRRGRICVCVPRHNLDPSLIQVMNEARRLRVMEELSAVLERDLMGVDAKWVLFTMAVQSYRYEQLVVPFPPAYTTPTGLNIDSLSFVTGTMTELAAYQRRLMQKLLPPEQVELMYWLFVQSDTPQLRQVQRNDQPELWRQLDFKPDPRPHLVFRVAPKGQDVGPIKPLELANCLFYCGDMEELFAMMSAKSYDLNRSQLEFYDDLETAVNLAEWCPGWGYSICGTLLRCVAVCQLHDHKRVEVRYLLFYSMCYTKQMQAVRRRQWKKDRERVEVILDYDEREQLQERSSQTSFFNMIFSRRSALVVLGVLTLASLTLVATNMRQVSQWRTNWLTRY